MEHYDNLYHQIYEKDKEIERLKNQLDFIGEQNHIIDKLKKENEIIKSQLNICSQDLYMENLKLKLENERLKEQCKEWKENHKAVCIQRDNILDNIVKNTEERIDYKSRNEKAKEFIEHENFKRTLLSFSENKYLKNI